MDIIYKFQSWESEYSRNTLLNSEIYFSNNFSFNDPYDMQLPFLIDGQQEFELKSFSEYFKNKYNKTPTEKQIKSSKLNWEHTRNSAFSEGESEQTIFQKVADELENKIGIFCASRNNDSLLMWGHYSNSHKGYCIGYDKKVLVDYLKEKYHQKVQVRKVVYETDIPILNYSHIQKPLAVEVFANKRFFTKYKDWEYECEIRIIITDLANTVVKIPSECYSEIILGYNITKPDEKTLKIICEKLYPKIKIKKAKLNSKYFKLDIQDN